MRNSRLKCERLVVVCLRWTRDDGLDISIHCPDPSMMWMIMHEISGREENWKKIEEQSTIFCVATLTCYPFHLSLSLPFHTLFHFFSFYHQYISLLHIAACLHSSVTFSSCSARSLLARDSDSEFNNENAAEWLKVNEPERKRCCDFSTRSEESRERRRNKKKKS